MIERENNKKIMNLVYKNRSLFLAYCQNDRKHNAQTLPDLLPENCLEILQDSFLFNNDQVKNNTEDYGIVFESFNVWSSFKEKFQFKGHDNLFYYDKERKYVGLNKKMLENPDMLYHKNYKDSLSVRDFATQGLFHEIGHMVQNETMEKVAGKFTGICIKPIKDELWAQELNAFRNTEMMGMIATPLGNFLTNISAVEHISETYEETFAELFSFTALTLCTSEDNALKIMQMNHEMRAAEEKQNPFAYKLSESTRHFIEDFKAGKRIESLAQLQDYVAIQTRKTIYKQVESYLNNPEYLEENLFLMGMLNKSLNTQQTQITPFLRTLEGKWNIKINTALNSSHSNYKRFNIIFQAITEQASVYEPLSIKSSTTKASEQKIEKEENKEIVQDKISQLRHDSQNKDNSPQIKTAIV